MTLLEAVHLSGGYGNDCVIRDVSFSVQMGEFIGIIGPNACGKSTLLRLISHALEPMSGSVYFNGKDLKTISLKEFCQQVAFVTQEAALSFPVVVEEMVYLGRTPHHKRLHFETQQDRQQVQRALELTDTTHLRNRLLTELSAGERQRVMLAKALAQEPILLFLDEPTSHLDIGRQVHVLDLLKWLKINFGLTVIIVLHDLNLASEYCERLILMKEGELIMDADPDKVLTEPLIEHVYGTKVVRATNPMSGHPTISPLARL